MPKVYITTRIAQEAIDLITPYAEVDMWQGEEGVTPHKELLSKVADIEGLVPWWKDKVDSIVMDAAPKLKVIANYGVGYDSIDVEEASKRGIPVSNTPGVLTDTTADLAFVLMLASARRLVEMVNLTFKGGWKSWSPMALLGCDVHHKTLGLIGLGRIGATVAKRAKGFSMKVIYYDSIRRPDESELGIEYIEDIPTLLGMSDFVSIHVPLTSETKYLIGAKELSLMKPTGILINTSRGPVVDQKALYEALKRKQIRGAAIDVTETEPIPLDDPLLSLDNIVISPHIGSATEETRAKMSVLAAENLIAGLKGEPMPNCVNYHLLSNK